MTLQYPPGAYFHIAHLLICSNLLGPIKPFVELFCAVSFGTGPPLYCSRRLFENTRPPPGAQDFS